MVDREAAARAIEDFLRALGHEPTGDLAGTGERVADAWADDLLEGDSIDAGALLREGSIDAEGDDPGLVVVRDLSVSTMCPHHLLPALGVGMVAYLPGPRIAGIGTIAHVLDVLSRRLTLQERIGAQVVDAVMEELGAKAALCRLALSHACLAARGERKANAIVETVAVAGSFAAGGVDRDLAIRLMAERSGR
jgi:GTP cyclohydrolase IA